MLKSWKTRALATAGAVALAAPFAFMGGASAVPGAPTITSLTPSNGPSPSTVAVVGTGCGTTAVPATGVDLFVTGPGITTPTATPGAVTGGSAGDFTGSVTISGRPGESFTVVARCRDATGQGPVSSGGPTFTVADTGITGTVTGIVSGAVSGTGSTTLSGSTSLSGTSITSTSGTNTGGATGGTTSNIGGTTSGVATPITQTPTFTG